MTSWLTVKHFHARNKRIQYAAVLHCHRPHFTTQELYPMSRNQIDKRRS
jgi:hypothetical protein